MEKFINTIESKNLSSRAEGDLVNEQTFQSCMHKVLIWDFLKVDHLEYVAVTKEQNLLQLSNMFMLDTGLIGKFIRDCKLLFLFIFCSCLKLSC